VRRHRFGMPALLATGLYVGAVAVAAVIAPLAGDLGALWRLTLFTEVNEDVAVTWPNTFILVLAGLPCAWALWQSLRGPLAGPSPDLDREVRWLRSAGELSARLDGLQWAINGYTLSNTFFPLGTATGVAAFGAIFTARIGAELPGQAALVAGGRFDLVSGTDLEAARSAFADALSTTCLVAAGAGVAGVAISLLLIRARDRQPVPVTG
jgi:hypothetical protein